MNKNDNITKMALMEAMRFNKKVSNYMNTEDGKKIARFNAMKSDEYMKAINESGYITALNEKDFHSQQEKVFWVQLMEFMDAFRQESEYQLAFWIEYLRLTNPEKHAEITATFKEVKKNEDEKIEKDQAEQKNKENDETMKQIQHIQPMNSREKTTIMATTTSAFSSIFSTFRGITEIMQAVYGDQIDKMREQERLAVKEDDSKPKVDSKE